MQVIWRRDGQAIRIGEEVLVLVLGIEHDGVRLGVFAPDETPIVAIEEVEEGLETPGDSLTQ